MKIDRRSRKAFGERVKLEEADITSDEANPLTREDIEEAKKFLDDLLEMHTESHALVGILISASYNEAGAHARERYYKLQREAILKQKLEDEKNEPL